MRSFTSSRPVWSSSRIFRASAMSRLSSVRTSHGISVIQSRYVRIHPYSGDCSEVRSSRPSSRSASVRALSGMLASAIFLRYSSTTFSPPSSPSSLRIASICWRKMYSRWFFSRPSRTSVRILSFSSSSASTSRAHSRTRSRRCSTSMVSRTSTFCSNVRSGEYPDVSAIWPGSPMPRRNSPTCGTPRASTMFSIVTRYSRASSRARGVDSSGSGRRSTSTQIASPVPGTPRLTTARCSPRITSASSPFWSRPTSSTLATVPTCAKRWPIRGTSNSSPSVLSAAATARRASSDSTVSVTTIPGSTTPVVSGRSGRTCVSSWGILKAPSFLVRCWNQ